MARSGVLALRRFTDVEAFERHALPFLMLREAEHNLFIGICSQVKQGRYNEPYLATVDRDGDLVAAAFRTPPHQVGLSCVDDYAAIPLLVGDLRAAFDEIPGVVGKKDDVHAFAERWKSETGASFAVAMEQRIYEAADARAPAGVDGAIRDARTDDRDLLIDWINAFHAEAGGIMSSAEEVVDSRLAPGTSGLVMWCTDEPVCMAGYTGPTPNGIRVGPVYTPPDKRRHGYGTACVAALTRRLLDEGRRFVFLYTDLANPTSNSIYQQIGYRPVCDVDQYRFEQ